MKLKTVVLVFLAAALLGGGLATTSHAQDNDPELTMDGDPQYWPALEKSTTEDIAKDSHDALAWQIRGTLRDNLKNYDAAIADFTTSTTLKLLRDKSGYTFLGNSYRGRTWVKKNEPLRALVDAIAGCTSEENYALAWSVRGDAWYAMGELKEAQACLKKSLSIEPERTRAYTEEGARRNAEAYLKDHKPVDLTGKIDPRAKFEAALAAESAGKPDEEMADYTEVIEISPLNGNAWGNRGSNRYRAGRFDAAIADYSMAITCNAMAKATQDQTYYLRNRSIAYSQQGRFSEAVIDLELALKLVPGDAKTAERLKSAQENLLKQQEKPTAESHDVTSNTSKL